MISLTIILLPFLVIIRCNFKCRCSWLFRWPQYRCQPSFSFTYHFSRLTHITLFLSLICAFACPTIDPTLSLPCYLALYRNLSLGFSFKECLCIQLLSFIFCMKVTLILDLLLFCFSFYSSPLFLKHSGLWFISDINFIFNLIPKRLSLWCLWSLWSLIDFTQLFVILLRLEKSFWKSTLRLGRLLFLFILFGLLNCFARVIPMIIINNIPFTYFYLF